MKKGVYIGLTIFLILVAFASAFCAITVKGGGFLDLSNIARYFLYAISGVCAITAFFTRKGYKAKKK